MTSQAPASIEEMLLRIPVHVRTVLEEAMHTQVTAKYAQQLRNELAAIQAAASPLTANANTGVTASQGAAASLPTNFSKVTPVKAAAAVSRGAQRKRKASNTPIYTQHDNLIADATIAPAGASADVVIVIDSDSDDIIKVEDNSRPKREHGLKIIDYTDICRHLEAPYHIFQTGARLFQGTIFQRNTFSCHSPHHNRGSDSGHEPPH